MDPTDKATRLLGRVVRRGLRVAKHYRGEGEEEEEEEGSSPEVQLAGMEASDRKRAVEAGSGAIVSLDPVVEMLVVDVALLILLLTAPRSTLRDETWAALAEASQEMAGGRDALRLRAALGLLSDEDPAKAARLRGENGFVETSLDSIEIRAAPSGVMAEAARCCDRFAREHQLVTFGEAGMAGCCFGDSDFGYLAQHSFGEMSSRWCRRAEKIYRAERTDAGEETLVPSRCVVRGARVPASWVAEAGAGGTRGGKGRSTSAGRTSSLRYARAGWLRGVGFLRGFWRNHVNPRSRGSDVRHLRSAVSDLLDAAREASEEFAGQGI